MATDYTLIIRGLENKKIRQEAALLQTNQQLEVWKAQQTAATRPAKS